MTCSQLNTRLLVSLILIAVLSGGSAVSADNVDLVVGGGKTLRVMRPDGKVEVLLDPKKAAADEMKLVDV